MTGARGKSALVAAFFALHPLHVESVAWISERKDLLCTFFWFWALVAYESYCRSPGLSRYGAVAVLFALALASKPMAVTFPFLLLVLDFWPLKRFEKAHLSGSFLVWEKVPLLLLSAVSSVLTIWAQKSGNTVASLSHFPPADRLANAIVSYVEYLIHTVWPVGLTVFYPYRTRSGWEVLSAAAFLVAVTAGAILWRRRHPYLLCGWFWYLGTLVPVIGLFQVGSQRMADRYTYVPLVGIFIIAAWGAGALLGRIRAPETIRKSAGVLAAAALVPVSVHQASFWENSLTLFSRAVAVERQGPTAHFQLATALSANQRFEEAIVHYRQALAMNPDAVDVRGNLAMTYLEAGKTGEALGHLKEAIARAPEDPGLQNNLGTAYLHSGNPAAAVRHYEKALGLNPLMVPALYNLARIYAVHPQARFRNGARAVLLSERLCNKTQWRQPVFLDILAAAHAEAGDFDRAVQTGRRARKLAEGHGLTELVDDLAKRISRYRRHLPDRRAIP